MGLAPFPLAASFVELVYHRVGPRQHCYVRSTIV